MALITVSIVLGAAERRAEAFEWAGKLRVTVAKLRHPKLKIKLQALRELEQFPILKVQRYLLAATQDIESDTFRVAAARLLVQHKVKAVLPVLVEWLSDFELPVRVEAARLLGEMGSAKAVGPLLRTFGDFEHKVRMAAVRALGRIGSRKAVTGILGRLNDANPKVRRAAIKVLSELTDPRAVIPLLGKLTDPSRDIRQAAVKTLAKIGDPRSVPPILRLLKDPATQVRLAAIAALGTLHSTTASAALVNLFRRSTDVNERRAVIKALGRLGTKAAHRTLLKALGDYNLRQAVRDALVAAGPKIVPRLARTLSAARLKTNAATLLVRILRDIGDKRASRALVREFHRGRVGRKLVVEALATCGDSTALVPLLVVVAGKDVPQQRLALNALLHIVDRRAVTPLLPVLESKDSAVRLLAVQIMGKLRARKAVPRLLKMLDKDSTSIRVASAYALGRIGDKQVGPKLVPLLSAKEAPLRRAAFNALATLRPKRVVPSLIKQARSLDDEAGARATALDAVGAVLRGSGSADHAKVLLRLIGDPNQGVATAALTAIAAIGGPGYAAALAKRLTQVPKRLQPRLIETLGYFPSAPNARALAALLAEKRWRIRAMAVWALGRQGRYADRAALLKALGDQNVGVRTNAVGALLRLGHKAAIPRLRAMLRKTDGDVNLLANVVLALGRLGDKPSGQAVAQLLASDLTNRYLEKNIIRALLALGWTRKAVISRVETRGDDDLVRVARELAKARPTKKRTWVGIDVVDERGHRKSGLPLVLVLPNGLVRWTLTDERGKVFEEGITPGEVNYEYVRASAGRS